MVSDKVIFGMDSVPTNWDIKELKEIGKVITGGTPKTSEKTNWNGTLPFVSPTDISDHKYVTETERTVQKNVIGQNRIIPEDSILYTCIASIGKIAISSKECTTNQQINSIVPNADVKADYLYYTLLNRTRYIRTLAGTTAVPIINKSLFSKIKVPIPTLEEQQKIAAILSSVDEAIEKIEQIIEQTETVKKGLMQQLLTKGIAHTEFKDTPIGKIPSSWDLISIDELFVVGGGMSYSRAQLSEEGYPYIHYGDIHASKKQYLDTEDFKWMPKIKESKIKQGALVQEGDIVISDASEDTEGIGRYLVIRDQGNELIVSGLHTIVLKEKMHLLNDFYKEYVFQGLLMKKQFRRISTGATVYGISKGNVKKLLVPVPPKDEQVKIASVIVEIDRKIARENSKLPFLQNVKKGLMQQLLTGKVRVPIDDNEEVPT